MADKVIVTNVGALKQKYGAAGIKSIQDALKDLIAADKKRGLATVVVPLDDAAAMKKLKATAVKSAASPRENKKAIDGVYKALAPAYLMILGAIDVIPHQDLRNPLYTTDPVGDMEEFADADLPYACDAPYSQDIRDFTGPTRVVGRLPDLTGATGSPSYLVGLLKTATKWKPSPRSAYESCLAISAEKWRGSTSLSLKSIFNSDKDLRTTPKKSHKWKLPLINRRVHFINCHGGDTLSYFQGESATDGTMPISHRASYVAQKGNIAEGTVAAAECCFGGQLYNPSAADEGQMGICNAYLAQKAYGFFASTTTAYGPFDANDQADLICQFFIQRVLAGASLGRAALEARQRFVERASPLSPTNRKTLAQFNLYGDPSITPVEVETSKVAVGPKSAALAMGAKSAAGAKSAGEAKAVHLAGAVERADRRATLRFKGALLAEMQPTMSKSEAGPPKAVASSMRKMMSDLNCQPGGSVSFRVESAPQPSMLAKNATAKGVSKTTGAKKQSTTAFHVMFGVPAAGGAKGAAAGGAKSLTAKSAGAKAGAVPQSPVRKFVVLEAKEVDGKIVSVTEAHSK